MNDAKDEGNPGKNVGDFQIEIDPKLGDPLQDGLNVLSKVFGGLVQTIKDAVGHEFMRGMELANWLEQLATCLEQIARSLRETGEVPAERAGELAFFVDQWDNQFQGVKLVSEPALRQRLDKARQALDQSTAANAKQQAAVVLEVAGYFRAAAKTALPHQASGSSNG
jgi:hypothetical protein